LKIGILTRNEDSWCSAQLKASILKHGASPVCFDFRSMVAQIGLEPHVMVNSRDIFNELKAVIVRPVGRGSLEEIIFRMDLLHRLARRGTYVLNPPSAIEKSVDKYYALTLMEEAGLPVPRTVIAEDAEAALRGFRELGGDVVIKPIFGSRGVGSTRVSDADVAERVFQALEFNHQVAYIQEFVPHGNCDFRIFVLGGRALASMRRAAENWKTNVSRGAKPEPYEPSKEVEELSIKASETVGCEVAGVDVMETEKGSLLIELNSQPGWKGLQSVTEFNIADEVIRHVLHKVRE